MQTKVSTKGQVVLPSKIRRILGLQPGDTLDADLEGGRIILIPQKPRRGSARIIKDPVTGLPILTVGADAPELTSEQVREILAKFP